MILRCKILPILWFFILQISYTTSPRLVFENIKPHILPLLLCTNVNRETDMSNVRPLNTHVYGINQNCIKKFINYTCFLTTMDKKLPNFVLLHRNLTKVVRWEWCPHYFCFKINLWDNKIKRSGHPSNRLYKKNMS